MNSSSDNSVQAIKESFALAHMCAQEAVTGFSDLRPVTIPAVHWSIPVARSHSYLQLLSAQFVSSQDGSTGKV